MRHIILAAAFYTLAAAAPAHGRLFWETYGATRAADDTCVWNANQDYFVPRYCDSGRYDLLSPCRAYRTRSAACKHMHPVYRGYCTPYSSCRYRWRDHVYQARCGCTPLGLGRGPWGVALGAKHALVLRPHCDGGSCFAAAAPPETPQATWPPMPPTGCCFPSNVEPLGGVILGSIAALPAGAGASAAGGMALGAPSAGPAPSALPAIGITQPSAAPAAGALPPVSSF